MDKKIIVSVISDLVTDQRVLKECNTLHKLGYDVLLVGRYSANSFGLKDLPYKTIRFHNLFKRGPLMYCCFNIQLFFFLLFKKAGILWSNDLDTLLPNYLVSKFKKIKLIYDSHEYFTESVSKNSSKKIWTALEKWIFPNLKNVITVNQSIQQVYEKKYGVNISVLRNVPYLYKELSQQSTGEFAGKKILLMQGRGINENRGAEEAVLTMQFLPDEYVLFFAGSGTVLPQIKKMVNHLQLSKKVFFRDVMPYNEMMKFTSQAYLSLIFEQIAVSDEHRFALPNRFFDYVHAGVPVLSSRAIEIEALINEYEIGTLVDSVDPRAIAEKIIKISSDNIQYQKWKTNTATAALNLNWEREEQVLIDFMKKIR